MSKNFVSSPPLYVKNASGVLFSVFCGRNTFISKVQLPVVGFQLASVSISIHQSGPAPRRCTSRPSSISPHAHPPHAPHPFSPASHIIFIKPSDNQFIYLPPPRPPLHTPHTPHTPVAPPAVVHPQYLPHFSVRSEHAAAR